MVDIILAIRNKAESESNFSEEAIQCIAEKYDYKFLAEELLKIIEGWNIWKTLLKRKLKIEK